MDRDQREHRDSVRLDDNDEPVRLKYSYNVRTKSARNDCKLAQIEVNSDAARAIRKMGFLAGQLIDLKDGRTVIFEGMEMCYSQDLAPYAVKYRDVRTRRSSWVMAQEFLKQLPGTSSPQVER